MSSRFALSSSIATLAAICTLLVANQAQADLTESERCQIKGFVQAAEISTVSRLRALVARPDVSHEHRAQALASALRVCPFDSRTQRYLDALLLGPSSQESRSALARAVVPGLLARADIIYMQHPGEPTRDDGAAADELLRIHRFALSLVQQVEQTEGRGTAGLSRDARRAMVDAYQQHIARHRRWLGFQGRVTGIALVVRAHVACLLRELAPELVGREQTAGWLGLSPSARAFFARTGVLVDDGGLGPDVRLQEVIAMIEAVPNALDGVAIVLVSKAPPVELRSLGDALLVRSPLVPLVPRRNDIWPADVQPAAPEQALVEAAFAASRRAARVRLEQDAQFARQVDAARERASGKGDFGVLAGWLVRSSLDPDQQSLDKIVTSADFVAAAATMLLLDAPRTVDLAAARLLAGRPESFEQVALGIQLLATAPGGVPGVLRVRAGRLGPEGVTPLTLSAAAQDRRVVSFELEDHTYALHYTIDDVLAGVTRNGGAFELSDLTTARIRTTAGDTWQVGDRTFVRLHGQPRVGVLGSKHMVVDPSDQRGHKWDAVYTEAPDADHRVDIKVRLEGHGTGGLLVGASTGTSGFTGLMLRLACETHCTAQLVQFNEGGSPQDLSRAVALPLAPMAGYAVRFEVQGDQVTAQIASRTLRATLREPLTPGHVGWVVGTGSRVFLRDWEITRSEPSTQP